jgi:hypothetical protein
VLEFHSPGGSEFDRLMTDWISHSVRIRGGGSVETAFGTKV